jgi:hypothetical protein
VDAFGDIFVAVPYRNDPTRLKKGYLMGNISEIPPLPANATEKQKKAYNNYMEKVFAPRFARLPDMEKIYNSPEPPAAPPKYLSDPRLERVPRGK